MKTQLERIQESMIPSFLIPQEIMASITNEHHRASPTGSGTKWEDWSDKTKFKHELFLRAASFRPMGDVWDHLVKHPFEFGTDTKWKLMSRTLPRKDRLRLYKKNGERDSKRGWVQFDDDIEIPMLVRNGYTLMSITPNECITLRPGARLSKGHTVITGLGMGYLLMLVCNRPKVKKVTLIEIDPRVVAAVMPRIKHLLRIQPEIVIGDCYKEIPKQTGDVILLDHYDDFGWNYSPHTHRMCKDAGFKQVWFW